MPGLTRIRVGIVSYEVADRLEACLSALPAALEGVDAQVVVVDNASTDGSAKVATRHDVFVVRNPVNVGYARAMNVALDDPDADVLIALNPDTVPPPRSLRRLVEVLQEHPEVAIVAPRLIGPDGQVQHSAHRFPWLPRLVVILLLPRRFVPRPLRERLLMATSSLATLDGPVDWAIGAVHVLRGHTVGHQPYRERWFMYAEDIDLCWRMRRAGHLTWFAGSITVMHEGSASAHQVFGPDPSERWWRETYDWYALARGRLRCRLYALVNAAAATRQSMVCRRQGRDRAADRWRAHARRHLDVVRRGPPAPSPIPDTAAPAPKDGRGGGH